MCIEAPYLFPPLSSSGGPASLIDAQAVLDEEFAEQLRVEEEEHRRYLDMVAANPHLEHPKSPAQVKHEAFNDEVVTLMKTGLGGQIATSRAELVAEEALVVLSRLNRQVTSGAPKLESETLRKYIAGEHMDDGDIWSLGRRRSMLALNVEYYMVQTGVIRPSVIVKKVCESVACLTLMKTLLTCCIWQDPEDPYRSDLIFRVKVS